MKSPLIVVFTSMLFRILDIDVTREFADERYDFIVVGAGTSGCVVASRLSDDPTIKVLLLEAGMSDLLEPRIPIPINRFVLGGSQIDWNYTTYPQENMFADDPNRTSPYQRGKVLGGTSAINYMTYIRGSPHDFDSWEDHGAIGWNYKSVEQNFRNAENAQGEGMPDSLGKNGRLKMTKTNNSRTLFSDLMSELARDLGMEEGNYIDNPESVSYSIRTVFDGLRESSSTAYIRPFFPDRKKRLHVISEAYATKILINDDMEAYGVQYSKGGNVLTSYADKEVILSAGVFATPHLLMLSGIGPKEELQKFSIPVRADIPGVGSNLQDHIHMAQFYDTNVKIPNEEMTENATEQFALNGNGPLADDECFYIMKRSKYYNTSKSLSNEKRPFPDILLLVRGLKSDEGNLTINIKIGLIHPKSTGKVSLRSEDPTFLPIIDPKFYTNPDDFDVHVEGHRFLEEIETSDSFIRIGAKYKQPSVCEDLYTPTVPRSKEFYECLIKHSASHMCHACGTAKIGKPDDKWAVADPELRVYGVQNLRVADASVMPHVTSGNIQAPCYMIGEKAAEMIKKYWEME